LKKTYEVWVLQPTSKVAIKLHKGGRKEKLLIFFKETQ